MQANGPLAVIREVQYLVYRFFELDLLVRSEALAAQFEERFSAPAEAVSRAGSVLTGFKPRAKATAFAVLSPLL